MESLVFYVVKPEWICHEELCNLHNLTALIYKQTFEAILNIWLHGTIDTESTLYTESYTV